MLARKYSYDYYEYENRQQQQETVYVKREVCNTALRKKVLAIVLMTLLFAFYMVMRNDVFIQEGYALVKLKEQEAELVKNIEYTKVNIAKAKSPERITVLAGGLGMVQADKNVYVNAVPKGYSDGKKEQTNEEISVAWRVR